MTLSIFLSITAAIGDGNYFDPDQEHKVALAFGLDIAMLTQSWATSAEPERTHKARATIEKYRHMVLLNLHISCGGAHVNLAVTLSMRTNCQISVLQVVLYMLTQILSAGLQNLVQTQFQPGAQYGNQPIAQT
ncbi:hypothetical protein SRHO_G00037470 [Serrasalmus rhombeus]